MFQQQRVSQGINPMFALMANLPPSSNIRTCDAGDMRVIDPSNPQPNEYPEHLGGLFSDNIIAPHQMKNLYYETILKGHQMQPNPLSEAFLEPSNIEYIRQTIENNLRKYTGEDNIRFLLTLEFANSVNQILYNNTGLAYDVKYGVAILNDMLIHHETEIALLSQRQDRRYQRWALNNDRIRVMPHGLGDKTLHVRGENQIDPSGYELNHPYQSQYKAFLRDVLQIQCPSNSTAPCRVPPFPIKYSDP
jgi:hypothetical protein